MVKAKELLALVEEVFGLEGVESLQVRASEGPLEVSLRAGERELRVRSNGPLRLERARALLEGVKEALEWLPLQEVELCGTHQGEEVSFKGGEVLRRYRKEGPPWGFGDLPPVAEAGLSGVARGLLEAVPRDPAGGKGGEGWSSK